MAKKNIDYGIMIRRRICEKYKLDVDAASQRRFDVFFDSDSEEEIKDIVDMIMKKIPRKRPVKYIDKCAIPTGMSQGADFILTYDKTMSINKCSPYAPINGVGQLGVSAFINRYADILEAKIETTDDIKKIYNDKAFLSKIIPRWIECFLACDYNVYLLQNDIKVINKFNGKLIVDAEKISISESVKYPKISYGEETVFEIAYVRATPNIRVNVKNIEKFIDMCEVKEKSKIRGSLGNATEKAICNAYDIENTIKCSDTQLVQRILPYAKNIFKNKGVQPVKYVGNIKGQRKIKVFAEKNHLSEYFMKAIDGFGSKMSSPVDFCTDKQGSISVKTTKNSSALVCPDTIGQPTATTCLYMLKRFLNDIGEDVTPEVFVRIIMNPNNLVILMKKYVEYLFLCDYLFYLDERNGEILECRLIEREEANRVLNFVWKAECFEYKKRMEKVLFDIKESVSSNGHGTIQIDYLGNRIGQFDIHKHHGRYIYQFRFNLKSILKMFNI